jgi:hypothetical protein
MLVRIDIHIRHEDLGKLLTQVMELGTLAQIHYDSYEPEVHEEDMEQINVGQARRDLD